MGMNPGQDSRREFAEVSQRPQELTGGRLSPLKSRHSTVPRADPLDFQVQLCQFESDKGNSGLEPEPWSRNKY